MKRQFESRQERWAREEEEDVQQMSEGRIKPRATALCHMRYLFNPLSICVYSITHPFGCCQRLWWIPYELGSRKSQSWNFWLELHKFDL